MKIGIIGSGNIGGAVGRLLAAAGHDVFYSFSRSEDKLRQMAEEAGERGQWGTPAEAVAFGEVILFAPPYRTLDEALAQAGPMDGKIVIDTVNPFTEQGPRYAEGGTAAEEIAGKLPGARTVKAYNHIYFKDIENRHHENPLLVGFISGDDMDAKQIVTKLVSDTGFYVYDLGPLATARATEPHGPLFNRPTNQSQAEEAVAQLKLI